MVASKSAGQALATRGRLAPGSQNWHGFPVSAGVPAFFAMARGAMVRDPDGGEYVDLYCGSGAVILGHADPRQTAAVRSVLDSGATVSLRHPRERELAERLVDLCPGAEYAAFFKTGSEAVHAAITTAVRATGRRKILTTTYHGWLLPLGDLGESGGFPVVRLDWSAPDLVARVRAAAAESACLVVSPTPDTSGPELVRAIVEAARAGGAVVMFDEVKAGFRYAYPTASAAFGVTPDLTVVSKAIGNGFPVAALLGGELLGDERTFSVFSTYASELVSQAAALACLRSLASGTYDEFAENSAQLYESLGEVVRPYGVAVRGPRTFFRLDLPPGLDPNRLCGELFGRGVFYHPLDQVLVSAVHGPAVRDRVTAAFAAALEAVSR